MWPLQMSECRTMKEVFAAFKAKNIPAVHRFWMKVADRTEWEHLVEAKTGIRWMEWQIEVGRYLMDRCRETPGCPYKPLLPEYESSQEVSARVLK